MQATTVGPMSSLTRWLETEGIEHEVHEHRRSLTAAATARAEGVDPRTFEKVLWVRSVDDGDALIVIDADDHLDLKKARELLKSGKVSLVPEEEVEALAPDCEPGAMPAVGTLFGLPTYADFAVREAQEISFNAGSHRFAVRVERPAWEKAAGVIYGDLSAESWYVPNWVRT